MKILFCGGGTAGHITPALALAEEFKRQYPSSSVAFVGRKDGSENQLILNKSHILFEIDICGFSRKFDFKNLKTVSKFLKSRRKAKEIINDFQPDAVVGTGGYVCAPVIYAAKKMHKVTAIHESNASPGLTTRLLAKKCDFLFLGANISTGYKNAVFTGNPVSEQFGSMNKKQAKAKIGIPGNSKLIVSLGGSIGAERINESVIRFMKEYVINETEIYHIHSTGKRYYEKIRAINPELFKKNSKASIVPFIYDMPTYLAAADLVICRCGAMTLSEVAKSGCPSILIPSPNVTGNHQLKNALYFEKNGAGTVIEEKNLNYENLKNTVISIFENRNTAIKMAKCAKCLAVPDSSSKIVSYISDLIRCSK